MLGQILRSLSSPLDTQYWEQGCLPLPSLLSRFTASLYRTIFKIEAKHNIHQTGTHTHAHRRLPRTAVRQLHSESTRECILPPLSKKGRACALGPHAALLPTIALLAARGREAGTGEGSASLTVTVGAEAIVGIPEQVIKGKPRLHDPEGQNSAVTPEELQGSRCGSGASM